MSLAGQPDPEIKKTTPGFGLKFLRDGMDSGNFVAMDSVEGQESWNYFMKNFSNHISNPSSAMNPLAVKFATATKQIGQVGLSSHVSIPPLLKKEVWKATNLQENL